MKSFKEFIDEMVTTGANGFTGEAPSEGPRAGYDKVMTQHPLSRWISAVTKKNVRDCRQRCENKKRSLGKRKSYKPF